MGLFASSKTNVKNQFEAYTEINPVNNNYINNDFGPLGAAISSSAQSLTTFVGDAAGQLSGTLRSAANGIGGGINGAGVNLAFSVIIIAAAIAVSKRS